MLEGKMHRRMDCTSVTQSRGTQCTARQVEAGTKEISRPELDVIAHCSSSSTSLALVCDLCILRLEISI